MPWSLHEKKGELDSCMGRSRPHPSPLPIQGLGNLSSLREDRCASHTSQVSAVRQLSSSSSLGALRFLGRSNVTSFRNSDGCRKSGSSTSIVCLAKPEETSGTERPDGPRFRLSAVTMPILAAVMVGVVQPDARALGPEGDDFALEGDRFAAPGGGGQFSSPSAGGIQPNVESSKGSQFNAPNPDNLKAPAVDSLKNLQPPDNPFAGLFQKGKEKSSTKEKSSDPNVPVAFRPVAPENDEAPITTSSPFLRSGNSYAPPAKPAAPVRDEPSPPGLAPADQREGPVGNVVRRESEVVNERTQGNANAAAE